MSNQSKNLLTFLISLTLLVSTSTLLAGQSKDFGTKGKRLGHTKNTEVVSTDTNVTYTDPVLESTDTSTTTEEVIVDEGLPLIDSEPDVIEQPIEPTLVALNLNWNKPSEPVLGYRIFFGITIDSMSLIKDVATTDQGFDPNAPSSVFNLGTDLGISTGSEVCFQVMSYTTTLTSRISNPLCTTI